MSNISRVDKAQWLKNWLDSLDFQIFTWHIDIGGPIESAIDWVLGPINGFIDWLNYALNWIEQAWYWVRDRVQAILAPVYYVISGIQNTISTWWSTLGDWFSGLVSDIHDWVDARLQNVGDMFSMLGDRVGELWNQVASFFSSILPTLARTFDVQQMINGAFAPWRDLFNFWGNFSHEVGAFFTNPVEYVWNRFTDWFFGG